MTPAVSAFNGTNLNVSLYRSKMYFQPLSRTAYELHYCFPTSVASIELSAESEGISDFEVTLAYTYHLTSGVNGVPLGAAPERE